MLIAMKPLWHDITRQLVPHGVHVHKAVLVAIKEDHRCDNFLRGKPLEMRRSCRASYTRDDAIIVHMKGRIAHDLKPMHDGFDRRETVDMGIASDLLGRGDVTAAIIKKEDEGSVDYLAKYARGQDCLPHCHRGQHRFPAEYAEYERRTSANQDVKLRATEVFAHEYFTMVSSIGVENPGGLMMGARATNTLIFSFSSGCMLNAANA